jgi:hypothetical protein
MVIACDAEALERMRKRADISAFGGFTIYCDEPPASAAITLHRRHCTTSRPQSSFER